MADSVRASTGRRFLAWQIDGVVELALMMVVPMPLMLAALALPVDIVLPLVVVVMVATPILYHGLCVGRWGQTAGKRLLRIRVARMDGAPVGYRKALLRAVAEFVLGCLWGLTWWPLLGRSKRALHDYLAGTQVIQEQSAQGAAPPRSPNITMAILLAALLSSLVTAFLVILVIVWLRSPTPVVPPAGAPVSGDQLTTRGTLSAKLSRLEGLSTPEEQAAYDKASRIMERQRATPANLGLPWSETHLSPEEQAAYERLIQKRNTFLAQPENADLAAFYMRRAEESRQGRDYTVDDYLRETSNSQAASVLEQRATAKYELQRQLAEYLHWRDKNMVLITGRWASTKMLSEYFATRPLLRLYLEYRGAIRAGIPTEMDLYPDLVEESKVDAFLMALAKR